MPSLRFTKAMQLTHDTEYQAVYAARNSVTRGPLRVSVKKREVTSDERRVTSEEGIDLSASSLIAHRSDLPSRIGLSVPGRVGTNVKRNRIKRLIREAFRLNREKAPVGHDFVIGVHPHAEKTLEEYAELLIAAMEAVVRNGQRSTPPGQTTK